MRLNYNQNFGWNEYPKMVCIGLKKHFDLFILFEGHQFVSMFFLSSVDHGLIGKFCVFVLSLWWDDILANYTRDTSSQNVGNQIDTVD